jgi:hypothetical protein
MPVVPPVASHAEASVTSFPSTVSYVDYVDEETLKILPLPLPEERVKRREEEIVSLQEALKILAGTDLPTMR